MTPACLECGIPISPKRKDSRFCSKKCYMHNYHKAYYQDKKNSQAAAVQQGE